MKLSSNATSYPTLRKQVHSTLLLGQQKIEQAKVQTYWRTGRLIQEHIRRHGSHSDHYGEQVVRKLAGDLKVQPRLLWRCVQFSEAFEIVSGRTLSSYPHLTWTHYRELMTLPDENLRLDFMRRAEKSEWTAQELAQKIQREVRANGDVLKTAGALPAPKKLIPKRGQLYTYRLIAPETIHAAEPGLWLDLGFQIRRRLPKSAKGPYREGQIVESRKTDAGCAVERSERGEKDLYTYEAAVERVVDGDTLLVEVDLGFDTRVREYLRLRGIDAPELATPEGYKARAFVERELRKAPGIILRSYRAEKYGRYLADVFLPSGPCLNQLLLDEGHAVPYEGEAAA